jgi:hypothetical protein
VITKNSLKPDFWIETVYLDGHTNCQPWFGSRETAEERCAQLIASDRNKMIDFTLLLSKDYDRSKPATNRQILADFQGYQVKKSKRWRSKR